MLIEPGSAGCDAEPGSLCGVSLSLLSRKEGGCHLVIGRSHGAPGLHCETLDCLDESYDHDFLAMERSDDELIDDVLEDPRIDPVFQPAIRSACDVIRHLH